MRLICPNCDAQYEVSDSAIPAEGRDVQCSNCGHAWFQAHPDSQVRDEDEALDYDEMPVVEVEAAAPQAEEPRQDTPDDDGEAEDLVAATLPDPVEEADIAPRPRRRELDENLMAVLREEAEREARAREQENRPVETQPELGLAEPEHAPAPIPAPPPLTAEAVTRRKLAMLKGEDEDEDEIAEIGETSGSRRDILPDIEEINSTLRATSDRRREAGDDDDLGDDPEVRRRSFRRGFRLILIVAVLGALVYILAPVIRAQVPSSEAALNRYVAMVDAGRLGLEALMQKAIVSLQGDGS